MFDECAVCLSDSARMLIKCPLCAIKVCGGCTEECKNLCPVCDSKELNVKQQCVECKIMKHVKELMILPACQQFVCYTCYEGIQT
jgi:hypothetical protein